MPLPNWMRCTLLALALAGCGGDGGNLSVCKEAEGTLCTKACEGVLVRCSYDGVEVEEMACPDGCSARTSLLLALCDAGSEVDGEVARQDAVCEVIE